MEQQAKVRTGFVAGDFMTRTYRISGELALRGEPMLDQLNNLNTLFLTLERVFVSPLLDPAVLTGNYPIAEVRKDNVGIVVLNQAKDGLPYREGRYVGRDHVNRQLLIVTAGFEVRGSLPLHTSVNVRISSAPRRKISSRSSTPRRRSPPAARSSSREARFCSTGARSRFSRCSKIS